MSINLMNFHITYFYLVLIINERNYVVLSLNSLLHFGNCLCMFSYVYIVKYNVKRIKAIHLWLLFLKLILIMLMIYVQSVYFFDMYIPLHNFTKRQFRYWFSKHRTEGLILYAIVLNYVKDWSLNIIRFIKICKLESTEFIFLILKQ